MKMPRIRLLFAAIAVSIIGCGDTRSDPSGKDAAAVSRDRSSRDPAPPGKVRPPAVAGAFYDRNAGTLEAKVLKHLAEAKKPEVKGRLTAAVVPHAGYVFSGRCAAAVYRLIKKDAYRRVIILGPTHSYPFRGIAVPAADVAAHRTPLGDIPIDQELCGKLRKKDGFSSIPGSDSREHSIEVQYPFLQKTAVSFKLVPLLCGVMSEKDLDTFAAEIASHLDEKTLLLASSDFTHYGRRFQYVPFTEDIRTNLYATLKKATGLIAELDVKGFDGYLDETGDTICGRTPIRILMRTVKALRPAPKGIVLDYYSSGDVVGNFRDCVSYGSIGFLGGKSSVTSDQ
ncbi:AmmeMemoRadiSam system protein B [Verrucomicrobiota bacterium]